MPNRTGDKLDLLNRVAACAMAVDALMGADGWNVINPRHIEPERERVYRAWLEFARDGKGRKLPRADR